MSSQSIVPEKNAYDIIKEIVKDDIDQLNPIYQLLDVRIIGKFDLENLTIKKALDFQGCVFVDDVDFRYSEFLQTVNLSKCTFKKGFNCGDKLGGNTIYGKNLLCRETIFEGDVTFIGVKCKGSGDFSEAQFIEKDSEVCFEQAFFGAELTFRNAIVKSQASFNQLTCGVMGSFSGVQFWNANATVDFTAANWGDYFICEDASFQGGCSFNSNKCKMTSLFNKSKFLHPDKDVDFGYSTYGLGIECNEATFEGGAIFNSIQCTGTADFEQANFNHPDKTIDFRYGVFGNGLRCDGLEVKGNADFRYIRCLGRAFFKETKFYGEGKEVDFSHANFAVLFNLHRATFEGSVRFQRLKCEGRADFTNLHFKNKTKTVDMSFASFQRGLDLSNAQCACSVDLNTAVISEDFIVAGTQIKELSLANGCLRKIEVGSAIPFQYNSLILTECTFESFSKDKGQAWDLEEARQFVASQRVDRFSLDPYIQLEKYFKKIGREDVAKDIYYVGHCAVRKNARDNNGNTKWSDSKWVSDTLLKYLTGYGVRNYFLFIWIAVVISIGMGVYWQDGALRYKPTQVKRASILLEGDEADAVIQEKLKKVEEQESAENPTDFKRKFFHRLLYSFEQFTPVVKLDIADKWEPVPFWRQIYTFFHKLIGWILIPLLVASISGMVKRE